MRKVRERLYEKISFGLINYLDKRRKIETFDVNLSEINRILEENRNRDDFHRGGQPELVLGCFTSLKTDNTEYCIMCKFWEKCRLYLEGFKVEENLFMKLGI